MTRTRLLLLVSFLLVFAAGISLGMFVAARYRQPPARHRSWLANELGLTPGQREQMSKIWGETRGAAFGQQRDRRAALAQERDGAIQSLLSNEQRSRYDAIQQEYSRKTEELSQERKRAFEQAVEQTKHILTPQQAAKYDELMKGQREGGTEGAGPPGLHGPRRHRVPSTGEATTKEIPAPRGGERRQTDSEP